MVELNWANVISFSWVAVKGIGEGWCLQMHEGLQIDGGQERIDERYQNHAQCHQMGRCSALGLAGKSPSISVSNLGIVQLKAEPLISQIRFIALYENINLECLQQG